MTLKKKSYIISTRHYVMSIIKNPFIEGRKKMKHITTIATRDLKESMKKGGCGECQTSCQSACKTSCTVGNQSCEKAK